MIPESELNKRAADNGLTAYEVLRRKDLYNLPAYQNAADVALAKETANLKALVSYLSDSDSGVRYWGAQGLMMLGKDAAPAVNDLKKALADESHNVRIMVAWALIKIGEEDIAYHSIRSLLAQDSYAMMEILNIICWMGDDAKILHESVAKVESKDNMIIWIRDFIVRGQEPVNSWSIWKPKRHEWLQ